MASDATILVIGTFDTKSDELAYLREQIESQGAAAGCMDVSVLGEAAGPWEPIWRWTAPACCRQVCPR